jgi:hypothetical protein
VTYFSVDVESTSTELGCRVPGLDHLQYGGITAVSVIECDSMKSYTARVADFEAYFDWMGDTKEWAENNIPKSYYEIPEKPAGTICTEIVEFVSQFEKPYTFVAWPVSFDFPMLQNFFYRFGVKWPFHYRSLDVKSYMCGKMGVDISASRDALPEGLWIDPEDAHNPYADALAQAQTFNALREYTPNG